MPKYRITTARFDVPPSTYKEFDAKDDEAAQAEFDRVCAEPANEWERMALQRIEQIEKTTQIAVNKNLEQLLTK